MANTSGNHTKVRFERFDSSTDEKRDEKNVYRFIQRMETRDLARHLLATEDRFDILKTFDRTGHTPLHFATYRNVEEAVSVLIEFVSRFEFIRVKVLQKHKQNLTEEQKQERESLLASWINTSTKGEEGFTAMHFASFHGNLTLIETFRHYGGDMNVRNRQEINMLHVAAQGDQPAVLAYFKE